MELDNLIADLERGLLAYATNFLNARSKVDEATGKTYITIADAEQNAIKALLAANVPLPEVTRYRIHFLLSIHNAVEV